MSSLHRYCLGFLDDYVVSFIGGYKLFSNTK